MKKQKSNEMTSIRKKLLAAVAMLLVACVMTVSSTYAWFTLSTAPEVKGITTTVGANGNLEIALGTYDTVYGSSTPSAAVGDSAYAAEKDFYTANITWGNLIDLSDARYGLGEIKLYPTRLNATSAGLSSMSPLKYAMYGPDGRVTELNSGTLLGKWDETTSGFLAKNPIAHAGVSAIGSASSMSQREFAVRNNKNAVESNRVAAKGEAQGAINNYAGNLAAIAINNMDNVDTNILSTGEVDIINSLILKLESANRYISDSIKSAILVALAANGDLADEAWETAVAVVTSAEDVAVLTNMQNFPTGITGIDKYSAIKAKLSGAKDALTAAGTDGVYYWSEVKDSVNGLLVASEILICGHTISAIKASYTGDDKTVFQDVTSKAMNGQLSFKFTKNSGIFADIAQMTGSYTATITFPAGLTVESIPLGNVSRPVTVESGSHGVNGDLGVIYEGVKGMNAPAANASADKALTDTYGYTIDLLFRTNATDSYLQLQTTAENRIYEGNTNENIAGSGSNMTFDIGGEYNKAKIDSLASGIRVVFYESSADNATILAVATLDTANVNTAGNKYKADLKLMNYTIADDGKITIREAITDNASTEQNEAIALTALTANNIKKITALVYLDGDVIGNDDVGVAALLSGKLNLQFSSSATLTPMQNNELSQGGNLPTEPTNP